MSSSPTKETFQYQDLHVIPKGSTVPILHSCSGQLECGGLSATRFVDRWVAGRLAGHLKTLGAQFKLRAELLYCFSPVNVFFIVAFKTFEVPKLRAAFRREYHYRVVSPLTVHAASGWVDVLYFWFAAISVTFCLRYLLAMDLSPPRVGYHCLFAFLAIRITAWVRWIIALFVERPDIAMFASCFVELVMEGFNGLFVGPADIQSPLRWVCYGNPMYYVYQGVLHNEDTTIGLPREGWGLPTVVAVLAGFVVALNAVALLGLFRNGSYVI